MTLSELDAKLTPLTKQPLDSHWSAQQTRGYQVAHHIDVLINELVGTYPPEKYPFFWLTLCRTLTTSLSLLRDVSQQQVHTSHLRSAQ